MASLNEIKGRIASVNSTLKITSAMKLVSAAKLRKAQLAISNMLPYQDELNKMLLDLARGGWKAGGEYVQVRDEVHSVAIVCVASNSSLCGGFNGNVARKTLDVIAGYRSEGIPKENIHVYSLGRKLSESIRRAGYMPSMSLDKLVARPSYADAAAFSRELMEGFKNGSFDKVELVYNHFKSAAAQPTIREVFLPLNPGFSLNGGGIETDFIVEPGGNELMGLLLPKVLLLKIYTVVLDSAAAEHAARVMAMQAATDNGNELLAELRLQYNKGRQQKITNEILDLVGGAQE